MFSSSRLLSSTYGVNGAVVRGVPNPGCFTGRWRLVQIPRDYPPLTLPVAPSKNTIFPARSGLGRIDGTGTPRPGDTPNRRSELSRCRLPPESCSPPAHDLEIASRVLEEALIAAITHGVHRDQDVDVTDPGCGCRATPNRTTSKLVHVSKADRKSLGVPFPDARERARITCGHRRPVVGKPPRQAADQSCVADLTSVAVLCPATRVVSATDD